MLLNCQLSVLRCRIAVRDEKAVIDETKIGVGCWSQGHAVRTDNRQLAANNWIFIMNADKIRNLTDAELVHQQVELADQLFKLKFQLKMGQTESLKKIRDLKKDLARIQTIQREKQLAAGNGAPTPKTAAPAAAPQKAMKPATTKKAATKTTKAATEKK